MYSTVYMYLLFALLSGHPTVIVNGFPPEDKINCSPLAISSVFIFAFIIPDATCSACKIYIYIYIYIYILYIYNIYIYIYTYIY